jgi:hypothetical protein
MKDERSLTGEFKRSHVIPALANAISHVFFLTYTKKCEKWRRLEVQGFCRFPMMSGASSQPERLGIASMVD